jgi:hypothetical protein
MHKIKKLATTMLLVLPLTTARADAPPPQFSNYRVSDTYSGAVAQPQLKTKQDKEFGKRLGQAAKQSINFAGHFVLTTWGCGADCVMGAILNARTGKVTWLPFTVCCADYSKYAPVEFHHDSKLIVIRGMRNEQPPAGTYYYVLEQDRLKPVGAQPLAEN